jgi:hypothetical protein
MKGARYFTALILLSATASVLSCGTVYFTPAPDTPPPITWGASVVISDPVTFADGGPDARDISPGTFGAWYPRMLKLSDGSWLATYGVYDNYGYLLDAAGGVRQQVARSTDNCRTWTVIATIADPGRDLENGQMIELANGDVLMATRSVRWAESYRLPVFRSQDKGVTWTYLSTIDANEGTPGSLGDPAQGVYEPHFGFLADGSLAVMYANEKHVIENPSYSQIISERISGDGGSTWGNEIWVAAQSGTARPGMPVWTRTSTGNHLVVFELCGTDDCNIYHKSSSDGQVWGPALGQRVTSQRGGPYVLALSNGTLVLTSNTGTVSLSSDGGSTWKNVDPAPFSAAIAWPSLYQTGEKEIAVVVSMARPQGGARIVARFGTLN